MRLRDLESVAKLAVVTGEKRGQRERLTLSGKSEGWWNAPCQ